MPGCGRPLFALPHKQGSELAGVSTRLELYWAFGTWLSHVSLLSIEFRAGGSGYTRY